MNFNGGGKTWIKVNEVVDSKFYKWGPKAYAKEKIMKLGSGEHHVWFTSSIAET